MSKWIQGGNIRNVLRFVNMAFWTFSIFKADMNRFYLNTFYSVLLIFSQILSVIIIIIIIIVIITTLFPIFIIVITISISSFIMLLTLIVLSLLLFSIIVSNCFCYSTLMTEIVAGRKCREFHFS